MTSSRQSIDTIRVTEVWFLKKKNIEDGFEDFHYDYKTVKGGMNDVSSTIVVNLGVFPDASEGMGEEDDEEAGNASEGMRTMRMAKWKRVVAQWVSSAKDIKSLLR